MGVGLLVARMARIPDWQDNSMHEGNVPPVKCLDMRIPESPSPLGFLTSRPHHIPVIHKQLS